MNQAINQKHYVARNSDAHMRLSRWHYNLPFMTPNPTVTVELRFINEMWLVCSLRC